MRSNDEFIENIYKKRDTAVKKRKKKIAAAASCLCVAVVAFVGATQVVPLLRCKTSDLVEPAPDIKDIQESVTESAQAEDVYNALYDGEAEIGVMPEDEYHYLTETEHSHGFGYDDSCGCEIYPEGELQTEIALETNVYPDGGYSEEIPEGLTDSTKASYTDEQIVDAAYSSLTSAEKSAIVGKSSNMSMASYEVNVGEFYEVWFNKTGGGYVKVKLDSANLERVN